MFGLFLRVLICFFSIVAGSGEATEGRVSNNTCAFLVCLFCSIVGVYYVLIIQYFTLVKCDSPPVSVSIIYKQTTNLNKHLAILTS